MNLKHLLLMALSFCTMLMAGVTMGGSDPFELQVWASADAWIDGISYAIPLFLILLAHELGHYLRCLRFGVEASFPTFMPALPIPGLGLLPFLGTFGAFIKMNLEEIRRDDLLQIGSGGPIAGFIVTVPVLFLGVFFSDIRPLPEDLSQTMFLGDSVLLILAEGLFFPEIPSGHDVFLGPMAMAGWTGCLLTALNLVPVGQLDGGHIAYTSFESWNRWVWFVFLILLGFGIFLFSGWLFIAGFVALTGVRHPPIATGRSLTSQSRFEALVCLCIFALCFAPAPIEGASIFSMVMD
ncbi:site-2 protease family protein [Microvenator marinus]|uniref:Site-2 protease family protein n=1 Tax=Microvenator marinus TaxID=2600177 RepID=A0A5B8Y0F8_9DELT|nr:site-2 protease family protein [Microvenator marinus]QED29823.1 site-2 protease family protein [Microvenator marinus]